MVDASKFSILDGKGFYGGRRNAMQWNAKMRGDDVTNGWRAFGNGVLFAFGRSTTSSLAYLLCSATLRSIFFLFQSCIEFFQPP